MKKFFLVGLLVSLQLHTAVSSDIFKQDSNSFCNLLANPNIVDKELPKSFLDESIQLVAIIEGMVQSLDEITEIQKESSVILNIEQYNKINKHIVNLNVIRKMLMHIKNTYQLSSILCNNFNFYKNSMDAYYYKLNPSCEAYVLKQCNISMKNTMKVSICCLGVWIILPISAPLIEVGIKKSELLQGSIGAAFSLVQAYLAYCAYHSIDNIEYEYKLIDKK